MPGDIAAHTESAKAFTDAFDRANLAEKVPGVIGTAEDRATFEAVQTVLFDRYPNVRKDEINDVLRDNWDITADVDQMVEIAEPLINKAFVGAEVERFKESERIAGVKRQRSDPLRKAGPWREAEVFSTNQAGEETAVPAGKAVSELFKTRARAVRLLGFLNAS